MDTTDPQAPEQQEQEKTIFDMASEAYEAVEAGESAPNAEPIGVDDLDEGVGTPESGKEADAAPQQVQEQPPAAGEGTEQPAAESVTQDDDRTASAPSSWKQDIAAKWADLPPEVKAEIHRREADYHKGIENYRQAAQIAQEVQQVVSPYMRNFETAGVQPLQGINHLLGVEHQLRNGTPEQKAQMVAQIARDYGVDLGQVQQVPPPDPQVQALMQQNQQLQQFQQQTVQQQQQQVLSEIQAFRENPANVHFEAVKDDMAALLQSGRADSLQDAYDKAVWMRPDIRQTLVQQQRTEAEQKAAQQQRKARAQTAAGSVKGSATSKSAIQPGTDIRTIAAMAFDGEI